MPKNLKVGIVGLGLIGGSIFKALLKKGFDVRAVSHSEKTIAQATEFSKNVSLDFETLRGADLVFVCTPMNKTFEILDKLEQVLSSNVIVTDTCSLKRFLLCKKRPYKFIPSHPMAGSEFSGFANSFDAMFQGAKWVLTPEDGNFADETAILQSVIEKMGAQVIFATAKEHDEAAALISHMPMLVSQALFDSVKDNQLAKRLASSGFRDMTRLALSSTEMAADMISMNADNIQNAILGLYSSIGNLLGDGYSQKIDQIKQEREKMYENGKNIL